MDTMELPIDGEWTGKSGIIALVGRANVGKSSLLNRILDEKISIVSPVAQTTRNMIRGILTETRGQLVFLDTPGIHKANSPLGKTMNKMARKAADGVDLVAFVLDAGDKPKMEDEGWMRRLVHFDQPVIFVCNKQDSKRPFLNEFRELLVKLQEEEETSKEITWLDTSAESGFGVEPLIDHLFEQMLPGPLLFPEEMLTDFPRKLAFADFIREKYFLRLHDEVPQAIGVWVDDIIEDGDTLKVEGIVYVHRPSQKGIVIGKKGRMLKSVEYESAKELGEIFEKTVKLKLHVKVEKDWQKNFWILRKLGYA
jgi:GTP-binding protein Era